MRGLRTEENEKFKRFFKLVQDEASKRNRIFFLDCGQGTVYEDDFIECEDLFGWLLPRSIAESFEMLFISDSEKQHEFDDFYAYIGYSINSGQIEIEIDDSAE